MADRRAGNGSGEGAVGGGRELGSGELSGRVPDERSHDHLPERSTVDDLIIKKLSNAASPFEEERLKRWREEASENEEYFQEMIQVWNLTEPEAVVPSSEPPSVEAILAEAPIALPAKRTPAGTSEAATPRKRNPWLTWGLLAASVAAVGLGIRAVGYLGPQPMAIYQASAGENPTVTLGDGSFVRLAQGSALREWAAEGRREVSLEGRAFFAVARDEANPFVIRTGSGDITVLGTRFQVDVEEERVETVVVEGLVRVSNDEDSAKVGAGSRARMREGEGILVEAVRDPLFLLDWEDGILLFQATPLVDVAAEVSRHYGRPIHVQGPELGRRRVTAWFQGEPFEAVAESICVVTEAICRTEGESVTMELGGNGRTGGSEGTG
ncbi:MAG: FecR domain-containing protein [Gemmatimonadota bacterium]|jgi:transmembrane sensor